MPSSRKPSHQRRRPNRSVMPPRTPVMASAPLWASPSVPSSRTRGRFPPCVPSQADRRLPGSRSRRDRYSRSGSPSGGRSKPSHHQSPSGHRDGNSGSRLSVRGTNGASSPLARSTSTGAPSSTAEKRGPAISGAWHRRGSQPLPSARRTRQRSQKPDCPPMRQGAASPGQLKPNSSPDAGGSPGPKTPAYPSDPGMGSHPAPFQYSQST